jgi:hypothetical protein
MALDIMAVRSARYDQNEERVRGDAHPCLICGLPVQPPFRRWLHLHDGGATIVTDTEAAALGREGDLDYFPVGPECAKKKAVAPYVVALDGEQA